MQAMIDTDRLSAEPLLAELRAAGALVKSPNSIRCPFHDDRTPSAGVYQGDDGVWRFKCQAASCGIHGDLYDIRAKATNRPLIDVLKAKSAPEPVKPKQSWPTFEAFAAAFPRSRPYRYTNPDTGHIDLIVLRTDRPDGKSIFQYHQRADGSIVPGGCAEPWPLLNRAAIRTDSRVIVVEGEKCVEALHGVGIIATTAPGGAGKGKAEHTDWSPLAGKTAYLWPDNDEGGIAYMQDVAAILGRLSPPASVCWIDPAMLGLKPKGDAADMLAELQCEADLKRATIEDIIADALQLGGSAALGTLIEDTIAGRRKNEPWPWARMTKLARALLPGTVTLICGDPGATKSFLLLEAMCYWTAQGIQASVYELEEDRAYHLNRALAQLASNGNVTDDEWVRDNPDAARAAYAEHRPFLDQFAARIFEAPDNQVTIDELAEWVEQRVDAGDRIIAVDPVTAAAVGREPWADDLRFMMRAKAAVRRGGASLVIVTHPKKGRKGQGLDELAGGAAYQRFSQTVFWVEAHQPKQVDISRSDSFGGNCVEEVNRAIHINKARNGKGNGLSLGFVFSSDTLRFEEIGLIAKEQK